MEDGKPDESDTPGKETPDDSKDDKKPDKQPVSAATSIEEARTINKETKELLDRREKILKREEDLHAVKMVGGQTVAGGEEEPKKEETNHDYRVRIEEEMAAGKTDFKDGD